MVGALILNDAQLQAIVAQAAMKASENVRGDFDLYWGLISSFAGILVLAIGFLGFSQFKDIKTRLKEDILNEVRKQISSEEFLRTTQLAVERNMLGELKQDSARLERQIELGRLQILVNRLKETEKSASESDRADLFDKIWKMKDDDAITSSSEFSDALTRATNEFYGTSDWERLDKIEFQFGNIMSKTSATFISLVWAYGFRVLAEHGDGELAKKCMFKYAEICRDKGYLEFSLPYLMIYEYIASGPNASDKIMSYFDDVSHLRDFEKKSFLERLDKLANISTFSDTPRPQHHRICGKAKRFADAYKPKIDKIRQDVLAPSDQTDTQKQEQA